MYWLIHKLKGTNYIFLIYHAYFSIEQWFVCINYFCCFLFVFLKTPRVWSFVGYPGQPRHQTFDFAFPGSASWGSAPGKWSNKRIHLTLCCNLKNISIFLLQVSYYCICGQCHISNHKSSRLVTVIVAIVDMNPLLETLHRMKCKCAKSCLKNQ